MLTEHLKRETTHKNMEKNCEAIFLKYIIYICIFKDI